ncbi:MAG: hypothetical protein GW843_07245 [Thiomicrospira sp.]|nr:hypothetical protein [Thiomicrospira sp.]PIQ06229.1 MAG: hypothetical protein COW74_00790 [Piscirickettsiaceae bacterium CG18_big_fil_WC_8_21_14_2_50_44_103]PIU38877.1 MAG: hypothetical protein COT01_04255 [Piscirickettsiaceae bacterium CG07_land_8_20_14_0_80_44_28]PIZ72180.1 MAG: hypothetical protein COY08_09795 [Piscirickettsiaceae bacterium CG_4_10_14_0_2_um_filter_44_336]PJC36166.1 MAG: hypothetical protein CO047_01560 [Piscirickettsiaceae bacterium CG_4_9_14_0_2_um_filter_44_546]
MLSSNHIAVNSRLSQLLKQQLLSETWQHQSVAQTPNVMTLSQWWLAWEQQLILQADLAQLATLLDARRIAAFEAELLWQAVLEEAMQHQPELYLLNLDATAKKLYQAWCFFNEYASETALDSAFKTAEVSLFLSLKESYQTRLIQLKLLDPPSLQGQRLMLLAELASSVEGRAFYLHGFDEIPPFVQKWIDLLTAQGAKIHVLEPNPLSVKPSQQVYRAQTPVQEAQQVANWCANTLEKWLATSANASEDGDNGLPRLGIVAPNIEAVQRELTWALDETLYQRFGQDLPLKVGRRPFYNVSLGQPLSHAPIVQNALQTLQIGLLTHQRLSYDLWSSWLTAPYTLGGALQRQQADVTLRRLQWASFEWPKFLQTIDSRFKAPDQSHPLPNQLHSVLKRQSQIKRPAKVGLETFVEAVTDTLNAFRWGQTPLQKYEQSRALSSVEKQQKEAFLKALEQFSRFYFKARKQAWSSWLSHFKRHLTATLHQPQTQGWVPIQIMGMLEAAGQSFDALWVMGLTDEAWPRMPNPNPFLPVGLQRDCQMPHSDAHRELVFAQAVTKRLALSAAEQVWSYACHSGDKALLPSPLLSEMAKASTDWQNYCPQDYVTLASRLYQQAPPLQWLLDDQAPPLPLNSIVPGGTGVLLAQSKCPLMAFVDYRLGARRQLETVEEGMQSNHLGTLVHEVLEHFWREVKTQNRLLMLDSETLECQLSQLLETAMLPLQNHYDGHYLSLEKQRILKLINQWLELERLRPSFAVVATEAEHQLTLGGLIFNTKIDRVDALSDAAGQLLIMDYKTGRASSNELFSDPILAPQLAVYSQAFDVDKIAGLGYGILHSDDGVKLDFVVAEEGMLPDKPRQKVFSQLSQKTGGDFEGQAWEDFLWGLREAVADLASQLQQGWAAMDYHNEQDVQYAAGRLALRLPEAQWQRASWNLDKEIEQ